MFSVEQGARFSSVLFVVLALMAGCLDAVGFSAEASLGNGNLFAYWPYLAKK
jgi:uncharacterized membrane protein YoaK (UPF0700 family)